MQPLLSQFRDHVSPSVAHVPEAAEVLAIGEFELFRHAYRWWHDESCNEESLSRTFSEYLMHETVPPWVRHYCRRVLILAAVGQLENPYRSAGFSTSTRWRSASSPIQSSKTSRSTASSGFSPWTDGCGQFDAHSIRSGAACTRAFASRPTSS